MRIIKGMSEKEYGKRRYKEHREDFIRYAKKYDKLNPWLKHHNHAEQRCNNPNSKKYEYYGGRGIKCLMPTKDFKYLWFRDKAYLLKRPSIDRIDNDGNYTLENCRFIELSENIKKDK